MNKEEIRAEIRKILREEVPKIIEEMFSRSKEQLRRFFINNVN